MFGLTLMESVADAPSQISFINVGQGDSALIQDDSGFDILIDGGRTSAGPTVVAFLKNQGVDTLEVMVASHADNDHIGGLISVLQDPTITVQTVYTNGYSGDTLTWDYFVDAVVTAGAVMEIAQFPQTFTWGTTSIQVLNPVEGLSDPDSNDVSIVILANQGETSILFTGDIDSTVEAQIIARGTSPVADLLKVSHHGSAYSSSVEFLNAVQPTDAVISVGDNPYGHPAPETIYRLTQVGATVWRTDLNGTIRVINDGLTYSITPEFLIEWSNYFLPVLVSAPATPTPTATGTPP